MTKREIEEALNAILARLGQHERTEVAAAELQQFCSRLERERLTAPREAILRAVAGGQRYDGDDQERH